jgi:hypothetical protein
MAFAMEDPDLSHIELIRNRPCPRQRLITIVEDGMRVILNLQLSPLVGKHHGHVVVRPWVFFDYNPSHIDKINY